MYRFIRIVNCPHVLFVRTLYKKTTMKKAKYFSKSSTFLGTTKSLWFNL